MAAACPGDRRANEGGYSVAEYGSQAKRPDFLADRRPYRDGVVYH